jgi:hypothetical protein
MRAMTTVVVHRRKRGIVVEVEESVSIVGSMADLGSDCCGCRWAMAECLRDLI